MPRKNIDTEKNHNDNGCSSLYSKEKNLSNKHICYFEKPKLEKDIIELYIYDSKKKIMNYNKK